MTKLQCNAVHCAYNKGDCCGRREIEVGGAGATDFAETCCESFSPAHSGEAQNKSCGCGKPTPTDIPVHCRATNCLYNDNSRCTASVIQMVGQNAEKCEQTSCDTFDCRCQH